MSSTVVATLAPILVAIVGAITVWRSRKRENAETQSITEDVWVKRFRLVDDRATRAEVRADAAEERANAAEEHSRAQDVLIAEMRAQIDDLANELADVRLRARVLTEALVEAGIEPNGWIERQMRAIEREETP